MSQLIEINTDNQIDGKKHNKKVNFIEKNKKFLFSKTKQKNPTINTDTVICYLNDHIDDSVKVIKSTKINIIKSNNSKESSSNKENELDQSNQSEFELSIISNHDSSIVTQDRDEDKNNISKNDDDEIQETNLNHLIQGDEYKPETDLIFSSNYLKLNQNSSELKTNEINSDDEINIIKTDQEDKTKVRSQFMQRFGGNKKKNQHIIPNIIDGTPIITTTVDSTPSTLQLNKPYFNQFKSDQAALTTASIAASLAAMSVINVQQQPMVVEKYNHLEEKLQKVLKELETLRKSDELLNEKLERKNRQKLDFDCSDDECVSIRKNIGSETRIKYLEKLQEKQFDMMSKLINVIGNENSQAFITAQNGKDNLNRFKQQISELDDTLVPYDDADQDYIKFKNNLNKKHEKQQQNHTTKKSRSRSKTRSNKISNEKKNDQINDNSKSRSPSAARSCCKMRNSPNKEKITTRRNNTKKSEFLEELLYVDQVELKQKEALHSPQPSLSQPQLPAISQSLKSATYSVMNNINDVTEHPLLFDKYLNQVKNKIIKEENESNKKVDTMSNNESNEKQENDMMSKNVPHSSMFSDIKEVLKAVEFSKAKIDANLADLARERNNKMFYLLNSDEKNDRLKIKKMVDDCINAISDDVKREVDSKLINEFKDAKLQTEKDSNTTKFKRHVKSQQQQQPKTKNLNSKLRSSSTSNLRPSSSSATVSQTRKYIDKLFGKQLLDQIKLDKRKEINRELENQLKQQEKLQRELELKIKKGINEIEKSKSKPFKNISNNRKKTLSPVETKRRDDSNHNNKIVITPRLVLDPNQLPEMPLIQSIKPIYSQVNYQDPKENRIALINLPSVDVSNQLPSPINMKPKKELSKQSLPPVNISHELIQKIDSETRSIDSSFNNQNETKKHSDETFDVNQIGAGIEIPGVRARLTPSTNEFNQDKLINQNSNLISDKHISELANETNQPLKQIDLFENKTYDWLEQELISRFVSKLFQSEPHVHDEQYNRDFEQQSETSECENKIDLKDLELLDAIGQQGLQMFVDIGQPVDQDLVQALIREVLEEKVASIASNQDRSSPPQQQQIYQPTISSNSVPTPSPRTRKSIEILSNDNQQIQFVYDVKTPVPTPSQSPPSSPGRPVLTPQISVEPIIQPIQPQIEPIKMNLIDKDDDKDESFLEKTIEDDNVEVELETIQSNTKDILVETPKETPAHSPIPQQMETPIESSESEKTPTPPVIKPIVSVKPKEPSPRMSPLHEPVKKFRSKSMQCDEIILPQVKPNLPSQTRSDTTSDITDSTQYTSEDLLSTSNITTSSSKVNREKSDDEEDTYISEGAWIISKSEGEIRTNDYVGLLSSNVKKKNVILNELNSDTSDGELRPPERGEVKQVLDRNSEKSEGELESIKTQTNNIKINYKKQTSKKQKSKLIEDKTFIDLKLSPNGKLKNNIKIESLSNKIKNRDSNDFERKLFSSTPDTTINKIIPSIGRPIQDEAELLNDDDDDYNSDEQEIELEYTD